jgi:lipopolysaccharide transport system ATP-binding protein
MGAAITLDGVWKKFRRGERHDALRDVVPALAQRLLRRGHDADRLGEQAFWALQDVSFEVRPGEAFGVIGPNGAGKSTILKLLTRILKPTRGTCLVRGRAAALIEVAAGFHPDLTGRENVFLQGAIMGMTRQEIRRKLDAIVEFAGTADFMDTPVKRYSNGMNARLGFSIAAHLDPEVLLIDEVLAVGDMAFQERCYQRMHAFKQNGVAIVFVSHNLSAVADLCDRVGVLVRGQLQTIAPPQAAFEAYARHTAAVPAVGLTPAAGTLTISNGHSEPVSRIDAGDEVIVRASMPAPSSSSAVSSGIRIRRVETGEAVFLTSSPSVGCPLVSLPRAGLLDAEWRFKANLSRGHYYVELQLIDVPQRRVLMSLSTPPFCVQETESELGTAYLAARCTVKPRPAPSDVISEPHAAPAYVVDGPRR